MTTSTRSSRFLHWIGWYRSWLSTRVLILIGLLTFFLLAGLLTLAGVGFRHDKLAYIYDLQDLRTEATSVRLRNELLLIPQTQYSRVPTTELDQPVKALKLARLPQAGEMFIGQRAGAIHLFVNRGANEIWSAPFSIEAKVFSDNSTTTYLINTLGLFLASSDAQIRADNVIRRPAVAEFVKSRLTRGSITVESSGTQTITGFREIAKTNVIVFVELSYDEAMAPFRRFMSGSTALGLGVIVLGIVATWLLLQSLWRPVREVAVMTQEISSGNYDIRSQYPYKDELSQVFSGLHVMGSKLKQREQSLLTLQKNLQNILSITLEMALAESPLGILKITARAVLSNVSIAAQQGAVCWVLHKNSKTEFDMHRIVHRGEVYETPPLLEMNSAEASFIHAQRDITEHAPTLIDGNLILPIRIKEDLVAILRIEGYLEPNLNPANRTYLETLLASVSVAFENLSLRESAAIKSKLESELETAQAVQSNLLPESYDVPGVSMATFYKSSDQTGGDWLGHHLDTLGNTLFFYIGDVTGHGVPSALLTGVACGAVYGSENTSELHERESYGRAIDPAIRLEMLSQTLNKVIAQTGKGKLLMTMAFCALELNSGKVWTVSAGHTPLMIYKSSAKKFIPLVNQGSILGLEDAVEFQVKETQLEPQDILLLYTDGLVENSGPLGETLKLKRVLQKFAESVTSPNADDLKQYVLNQAEEKWKSHPGKDDVSLFVVQWHGAPDERNEKEDLRGGG